MRGLRPKPCRLASYPELCALVADRLENRWSPQQVSGWLKATHPGRREMQLSHETIYQSLFVQARGVLKKELLAHLRSRRVMRRGKMATTEPPRLCRRPQLLRGWGHDEQDDEQVLA